MKKNNKSFHFLLIIFLLLITLPCYAWNSVGHAVIAQIAFDNLSPQAERHINYLLDVAPDDPRSDKLLLAAVWPDVIKRHDVHAFDRWHFIDMPFSLDGTPLPRVNKDNIVWALNQALLVEVSPRSNFYEKKLFLRFLLHFTGDITQPLHCATQVSKQHILGDAGGIVFPLSGQWSNLHYLWDDGAGYLNSASHSSYLIFSQIHALAYAIEKKYPKSYFGTQLNNQNFEDWSRQSFNLAKSVAYQIIPNSTPSAAYLTLAQQITQQQLALAGYRLAILLNHIFG